MRALVSLLLLAAAVLGDDGYLARLDRRSAAMIRRLEAEVERLRRIGAGADALERELTDARGIAEGRAGAPIDEPAVHLVALREGKSTLFGGMRRGEARVDVTATRRPVILVLSSPNPMLWDIRCAEGVRLRTIYFTGDVRQFIRPPRDARVLRLSELSAWQRGFPEYERLKERVGKATDCPVATFQGAERPAGDRPIEVGPGSRSWRTQALHARITTLYWRAMRGERARVRERAGRLVFPAVSHERRGKTLLGTFGDTTPRGPLLAKHRRLHPFLAPVSHAVLDPEGKYVYAFRFRTLHRARRDASSLDRLEVPDTLPRLNEPGGLALDTRRRRLLVASRDGPGYLYAFDFDRDRWSVINDLDHVAAVGLAYDELRDAIFAVEYSKRGTPVLHRFTPEGVRGAGIELDLDLTGHKDRELPLVAVDGQLVLLYPPLTNRGHAYPRAYVLDPLSGRVWFETTQEALASLDPMTPERLEKLWSRLAGADSPRTRRAIRELLGGGDVTVAFLRRRFRRAEAVDEARVRVWLELLDHPAPAMRLYAQYEFEQLGLDARPYLEELLERAPSPEACARARHSLEAIEEQGAVSRALMRELHAIEVLERIETPAAIALLEELVAQDQGKWIMRASAAKQSLERANRPR